jgi:hypothetical protein
VSTTTVRIPRPDPSPDAEWRHRPATPPRPRLAAVPDGAWRIRRRRIRRRVVALFGLVLALAPVFGLVLVHVDLTTNEGRLTLLEREASDARQVNVRLRLQVAQLEAPARIVNRAQQLGMEPPPSILYLTAVPDGSSTPSPTPAPPVTTPAASITGLAASQQAATTP